jgi:hypothetical protein
MHSSAGARAEPASPSLLCRGISLQVTGSIPGSDTWRSPGKSAAVSQELHMPNLGKCRHSGMPSNSHSLVNWTTSAAPRSVLLECMRCVVMLCRSPLGRRDGSRSDATLAARGAPSHNAPRADPPEAGRATTLPPAPDLARARASGSRLTGVPRTREPGHAEPLAARAQVNAPSHAQDMSFFAMPSPRGHA